MNDSDDIFLLFSYSNILFDNDSFFFDFLITNKTNQTKESKTYHPILYGIGIYALLLIVIGSIGNTLTIVVLLRSRLRQNTTMRYLIALAVADLCSLYSWNLNLFYKHLINPYQNDLEDLSVLSCRCVSFIAFVSLQSSSWFLTLVSVDRCCNIHFLFWSRKIGRPHYAVFIILTVAFIIILTNSHLLFLNGYRLVNCIPHGKRTCTICYSSLHDPYYIFPKWEKVHVILYNLIPFSIMLVSNCFIIRRSIQASALLRSKNNANITQKSRQRKQKQLTSLLLSVTFLFVLLTTPVMIYNVFLRNYLIRKKLLKYILHGTLLSIQFTSHASNFFIYCFGSSNFRHELNQLLKHSYFRKKK